MTDQNSYSSGGQNRRSRRGLTAIEYGLIASLVAVGILVSLSVMSNNISGLFNNLGTMIGKQQSSVVKPGQNAPAPPPSNHFGN